MLLLSVMHNSSLDLVKWIKCVASILLLILLCEFFILGYQIGKALGLAANGKSKKAKRLLVVSIDGFRFEYLTRGLTPNLAKLGTH